MLEDSAGRQVLGKDMLGKGHVEVFLESAFYVQRPEISLVTLEHKLHIWEKELGASGSFESG